MNEIPANARVYECRHCGAVLLAAEQAGSLMCPLCPGRAMLCVDWPAGRLREYVEAERQRGEAVPSRPVPRPVPPRVVEATLRPGVAKLRADGAGLWLHLQGKAGRSATLSVTEHALLTHGEVAQAVVADVQALLLEQDSGHRGGKGAES